MPIRDLFIFILAFVGIVYSLRSPVIGVLFYALFSYWNPHRLSWGPAFDFSFAKFIAIATIIGWIFYKGDKKLPFTREIKLVILLWLLTCYGWIDCFNPGGFKIEWVQFTKIILMSLLTASVIKTEKDLKSLYMVIALSASFYALKGVLWGLRGGTGHVWGPMYTFIAGNNEIGLFFNMCWPMVIMLSISEPIKWKKNLFRTLSFVFPLAIILTKSRGAGLTLAVVAFLLFLRLKRKILFALAGVIICVSIAPFVPPEWYDRMETIKTYEEDASAMGRINAWHASWNMALDRPLTGGGMRAFIPETIYRYAPDPEDYHDVHSIYFEILGEVGFPGLLVYLSLLGFTQFTLMHNIRAAKQYEDGKQLGSIADGLMLGLFAYMFCGLFLGLAYFDLLYHFVGMAVSVKTILNNKARKVMP